MVKLLVPILLLIIGHLSYRLSIGDGGYQQIQNYEKRLAALKADAIEKKQRNDKLYAEVLDLRKGQEALEERARDDLGMIRENETFFQVLD